MTDINPTLRDAEADLATLRNVCSVCDGDGSFGDARPYRICTECGGTGRDEPTECLEIGEYWIERCRAAETRVMYCSFCRAEFPPDTSHDVLIQHSMTCEKSPVVQENQRLRKIIDDATGHSKDGDGVDLLCKALYGRPGQVPDWLGGSEARMLYDAAKEIADLRSREVIEHDGTYFAPLGYADDTWEWYDASELHDDGPENLPHALYVLLSCPSPIEAFVAYPTREAALQALRDAIQAAQQQAQ